jgi:hypothetical protein
VKLRVHFLSRGRYWKVGEDIPDEDVPPNVRKYAVDSAEPVPELRAERANADPPHLPKQNGTHVKRGARWAKLADVELEPGEPTYRRKGKAFIRAGRVEKYARLVVGLQNEREGKRALDQIAHALCTELSHFHEKIADPN